MIISPTFDRMDAAAHVLDEWVSVREQINRLEARASELLIERLSLHDEDVAELPVHREAIWRSMLSEFSAAGRIAQGAAEYAFIDARTLSSGEFPVLRESFRAGRITASHVREILRASSPVTAAITEGTVEQGTLGLYETATVVFAEAESPSRTRVHAKEVAAALAGSTIADRHRRAKADRAVTVQTIGDGLALLQVVLPEHLAVAIHDRLSQMARHQKQHVADREPTLPVDEDALEAEANDPRHFHPDYENPFSGRAGADSGAGANFPGSTIFGDGDTFTSDPFDADRDPFKGDPDAYWAHVEKMISQGSQPIQIPADERTLDQIRADLLADLLLTAEPSEVQGDGLGSIKARIQVTVGAGTLLGTDDALAQLDGHGELHPDIARALAGRNSGWTRLFLDSSGMVTETDTYTPTEPMRRFLRARDQHCRFPGCRMPVHRCETDHTFDFALGGQTSIDNLAHLCKRHHTLKHPDIPDDHRWRVRQLPNWELEWTSPTGRVHTDAPPRRVMFAPSPATAPQGAARSWDDPSDAAGVDAPF
ncbi:DUF222 domain-containing protein [Microbacterium sp. Mu-80]|uniref:DUF222 domain-containing protein n=1 Tax=Microbacterium bandirmense TaxID=3122050 RepID=A0ABU8LCD2_9MICO